MDKYKVTWKEVITYEEVVQVESGKNPVEYCGLNPSQVDGNLVDNSIKIERIDSE